MIASSLSQPYSNKRQAWLNSAAWDITFIIGPAFFCSALALLFRARLENVAELPLWSWIVFILLVDVSHVYATLFRTYFNKQALEQNGTLLCTIPVACWSCGVLIYSMNPLWFWRALAYLAVFHFIRQQYGFMSLYSRNDSESEKKFRQLDECCIYLATLYPLAFWHTNLPRNFNWFVEGDFFESTPQFVSGLILIAYVGAACVYVLKEIFVLKKTGRLNLPKNLLIAGTALSWWVAIVPMDSDLSFTMVNVISHGVPYMALIWFVHRSSGTVGDSIRPGVKTVTDYLEILMRWIMAFWPVFLFVLFLFAYLEEGLWDGLIWREHLEFFRPFSAMSAISDKMLLALLVPLLSLPQSVHYVLDGFIWRIKDRKSIWLV